MDRFAEFAAFVRTVERGSQSPAARDLGVTPAMVRRYLQALEDRLGTRLLNRTTQRQSPYEAGAAFHAPVVALLEQLEEAERAVSERQPEPRNVLRVNGPMVFGVRYLAAAVAGFCDLHWRSGSSCS
jgi:DNA-binding transcriptional LysR family regulator